jgi:hypothetical protein
MVFSSLYSVIRQGLFTLAVVRHRICAVRSWKDLHSRNIARRIGSEERPDMGRQSRKAE